MASYRRVPGWPAWVLLEGTVALLEVLAVSSWYQSNQLTAVLFCISAGVLMRLVWLSNDGTSQPAVLLGAAVPAPDSCYPTRQTEDPQAIGYQLSKFSTPARRASSHNKLMTNQCFI